MTPVTLYNAARWNLRQADHAERKGDKAGAKRLRANAHWAYQRLKQMESDVG